MTTIQVAFNVPAATVEKIESHLEWVAQNDINWNGADFRVERDDFTCIPEDESPAAVILLNQIFSIINGRSED